MKKRSLLIAVYLCLLASFTLGLGELLLADKSERPSYTENRMLQAFPTLSAGTLLDGSFMANFERWLSDAFVFRDGAAAFSDGVRSLFAAPDPEAYQPGLDQGRLFEADEGQQQDLQEALQQELNAPEPDPARTGEAGEIHSAPRGSAAGKAAFWLERADGSRSVYAEVSAEKLDNLARVLGEYRALLPADGTLHLVCPPVSSIANQVIREGNFVSWGSSLAEMLQPIVGDGILIHESFPIAQPYLGSERLYPTVDHHWHPFLACETAMTMLEAQQLPTGSFYDYRYTLANSPYTDVYTEQELRSLNINAEIVEVMEPRAPAESYIIRHLTERSDSLLIDKNAQGYRQYLSGTRAPWRLFIGGYHTGRQALVIADSFGNCLIPYLLPYYDEVLSTDFRDNGYAIYDAGANAGQYMREYGIDDIYIILCSGTPLDGEVVQDRFERYLYLDYEAMLDR